MDLVALGVLLAGLGLARKANLLSSVLGVGGFAVAAILVLGVAITVSNLSRFPDCGPGGNLVTINGRHGVESRSGIQLITDQQYGEYVACSGTRSWLTAFATGGVGLVLLSTSLLMSRSTTKT